MWNLGLATRPNNWSIGVVETKTFNRRQQFVASMNFLRKFGKKTTVLVVDASKAEGEGRGGGGLRRAEGFSPNNAYHETETKLFEEPLTSSEAAVTKETRFFDQTSQQSLDMQLEHPQVVENPSDLHVSEMEQTDVGIMMSLYASIIRGEKSEVKKLLTGNPQYLEAPDNFGRTPLMYCVLADRLDCAKLLLKLRCNLDQVDKAGRSALHLAAHKASYKFLELLHARGGNVEMKDKDGQTPLHLTTRNKHARCLDFLLKRIRPGMVDVTDNQKRTALHWSAAFNNAEYVRLLIKHNSNVAIPDAEGKTPLHWAANSHDPDAVETIKVVLESAPSVLNWQDYDGRTALHVAVAGGNVPAVQFLLRFAEERCEVDRLDNTYRTPLHWAAQLGNTEIVKLLHEAGAKNSMSDCNGATPLLYAALNNNSEVVMEMVAKEPTILEQSDIEGRSALMWAAGKGANNVIRTLLAMDGDKVDVNRVDNKGNTALHVASWNGHASSVELLLNYNSRHDLQNNMNHTPLFGACEKGHLNVVQHLLNHNSSILVVDMEERSPLHWAALGGHAEVCDLLIKEGLHPDIRDAYHRTPLHCAAFAGFINCMNLLLENRANVDLQDQEGLSALHWAAQSGHLDATKLLFQCSAFPNLMEFTAERLTPLDHALFNQSDDVAQYLIEQGALSSETIRDIAAARIQACYRGYRVRKNFLSSKNLLMKHNMLRNKFRRDRSKLKPTGICEEPKPSQTSEDSVVSESVCSLEEIQESWMQTIHSRHSHLQPNIGHEDWDEDDESLVARQQYEDDSVVPPIISFSMRSIDGKDSGICVSPSSEPFMETVATETVATASVATETVATASVATASVATETVATEAVATEAVATETVATEAVATASVATASVATEPVATEPVATEPVATEPVATETVATEPVATETVATEPHKDEESNSPVSNVSRVVGCQTEMQVHPPSNTNTSPRANESIISTGCQTTHRGIQHNPPSTRKDRRKRRKMRPKSAPHPLKDFNPTASSQELLVSEYIESLMKMTTKERSLLENLQQNRTRVLNETIRAAIVIQRAFRRYLIRKYPVQINNSPIMTKQSIDQLSASMHNGHVTVSSSPHNGHVIGSGPPHIDSKSPRRLKKPRPKTVHRDHRKHRLLLTPSVDTSCDRLEELCKIYGQTLVLNGNMRQLPPKRRFKTVTAPSVKRFSYLEEPITAVETYEENLKQRDCKVTYGRSERHRVGSASPLQWQNIYGDRKKSSIFNPNNRPPPTKFSYNLTRTSY